MADNMTERLCLLLTASNSQHCIIRMYLIQPSLMDVGFPKKQMLPSNRVTFLEDHYFLLPTVLGCFQYASMEGEGLGDIVTCGDVRQTHRECAQLLW